MKILYIDVNYKQSSTGQIVYNLFTICKEHGIDAAVCYGRGPKVKEQNVYKFGLDFETAVHALLTRLTGYTGCFSFFSTRRLIRYIKGFKPDVVHIHELHAYFVNLKPLLQYLRKAKIHAVFTNHCEFLYTGKCGLSKDCIKYSSNCGKCPYIREYPSSFLFDHTSKMLKDKKRLLCNWDDSVYVSPSGWLNKKMDISFLNKSKRLVINNGIDTSMFGVVTDNDLKDKYNIPHNKKIVISVAPDIFSENKGGNRFLEIASKFIDDKTVHFVAVGAIDSTPNTNLNSCTILPLITNKKELVSLYSLADCFVICSRNENFPTTSIEAQCCGTKVVGYDVGGVKETILEGNGCVVPFNDVDKAKSCIQSILDENYSKKEVSEKAKKYYSKERMFNEYLEVYKELCN